MISALDHRERSEAETIREILLASYQEEARILQIVDFPPLRRTIRQIQSADSVFFGYKNDSDLVAVSEIENVGQRKVNIASLVVIPEMFRKGIGSALVAHVLAQYPHCDVTVSTARQNEPAIALYKRHGFNICNRWPTTDGIDMLTLSIEAHSTAR